MTKESIGAISGKVWSIVVSILVVTGGVWAVVEFIDYRVRSALTSTESVEAIARRVSSYIVFDGTGAVLHDPHKLYGPLIKAISIRPAPEYDGNTVREPDQKYVRIGHGLIRVHFGEPLAIPPLLNYYDMEAHIIGRRVANVDWEFEIRHQQVVGILEPGINTAESRYLLQVFR